MSGPVWYVYPPAGGPGLGRYWRGYHLARSWRALGRESVVVAPGFHHHFETPEPRRGLTEVDGASYYFLPTAPYGNRAADRLRAVLQIGFQLVFDRGLADLGRANPPSAIVYSSPYPFGVVGAAALARRYGAKFVFEVRDIWPLSLTELMHMSPLHPLAALAGWCETFGYRRADRVVGLFDRAHLHMVQRGMPPEKFAWIPNGADLAPAIPTSAGADTPLLRRARELTEAGNFLVVHAGNLAVTTCLEPLLEAAKRLQDRGRSEIRFLLVGRGEEEAALKARAAALGLSNLEFHGQVPKPEVLALLQIAGAGYAALADLPLYRFGFSLNKLLDYLGAGLPVVFAHDGAASLVTEAEAGFAVRSDDPAAIADAVARLADLEPAARAAMGAAGRAYVAERLDYRALARTYLELLDG